MKNILIVICIALSGCTTMQDTRKPQNKTTLALNVGYQEAYRLITKSLINDCELVPGSIQPMIFTDAGHATINSANEGVVTWSMDLKDAGEKTEMEFYSAFEAQKKFATRIQQHVNDKVAGCFYDEVK